MSILFKHQNEKHQTLQKEELEWFAGKIKMFNEEKQKAILASAYAFAEYGLFFLSLITIQLKDVCNHPELMYFVYSTFLNIRKERSDVISFL